MIGCLLCEVYSQNRLPPRCWVMREKRYVDGVLALHGGTRCRTGRANILHTLALEKAVIAGDPRQIRLSRRICRRHRMYKVPENCWLPLRSWQTPFLLAEMVGWPPRSCFTLDAPFINS